MKRSELFRLRDAIIKGSASLPDEEAYDVPELFPEWAVGKAYSVNERIAYNGKLYKVVQAHTSQADWTPDIAKSLFTEVAKGGQGDTPDNPIPYNNNMELVKDKYYSQAGIVYICFRDTGIPVYNDLKDLVGLYVMVYE